MFGLELVRDAAGGVTGNTELIREWVRHRNGLISSLPRGEERSRAYEPYSSLF